MMAHSGAPYRGIRLIQNMFLYTLILGQDSRQAHRIRRYLMGVGSSMLGLALMYVLRLRGDMEPEGFRYAVSAALFFYVLFYGLIRGGFNVRLRDPSLTAAQMGASLAVILGAMYYCSSDARPLFHLLFLMTFLFGIFRLDTFMMLTLGLFAAAGYGLMVVLLMLARPEALDLEVELLRWTVVSVLLVWFSVMGGYISRMRKQLSTNRNDLEKALQTIRGMTVQDELTGVPNRRFLMNALRQQQSRSVRTGEGFCVGLVDIDLFKRINDTLGHSAGDTVLRVFSESAMKGMRASDQFGRYGGEEFLLLLGRSSMPEARIGAERLRQNTAALRFPLEGEVSVTISIGLAEYRPGEDVEDTLKRADMALYRAKSAGRNCVECEEPPAELAGTPRAA